MNGRIGASSALLGAVESVKEWNCLGGIVYSIQLSSKERARNYARNVHEMR